MNLVPRVYKWGAVVMALFALVPGYYAVTLHWAPSADFDVTGILFVLQNLPRVTAIICTAVCTFTAVTFWIRSLRTD
jgi:hypothetical protein